MPTPERLPPLKNRGNNAQVRAHNPAHTFPGRQIISLGTSPCLVELRCMVDGLHRLKTKAWPGSDLPKTDIVPTENGLFSYEPNFDSNL